MVLLKKSIPIVACNIPVHYGIKNCSVNPAQKRLESVIRREIKGKTRKVKARVVNSGEIISNLNREREKERGGGI